MGSGKSGSLGGLEVCLSSPQSHARAPLAGSGADADADACRYLSSIYYLS
jgi:hypothetical protein